jgi:rubrerythrin
MRDEQSASDSRALLVRQLQGAYSGELAAGYAYRGHARSVRDAAEIARIEEIEAEEWHHRELVGAMLRELAAAPNRVREAIFWCVGHFIAFLCHTGGWFIPMFGAGKLERGNIVEYEIAAEYALACGREDLIECLLTMAEVEWEHERYFRSKVEGHWMLRWFRLWDPAPPKEAIRAKFAERREASRVA